MTYDDIVKFDRNKVLKYNTRRSIKKKSAITLVFMQCDRDNTIIILLWQL